MHSPKQFIFSHVNLPRVLAGMSALITALCVAWLGDGSYQIYDFYINSTKKKPDYEATLWSLVGSVFFSITTAYLVFNYSKVRELQKS